MSETFKVGDPVIYRGKTYSFPGHICGITDDGQYIVRAIGAPDGSFAGMKHIYGATQLETRDEAPAPQPQVMGDGEASIIECLAAGKPFVFDQATNFLHADDGTVEGGIRYLPADHVMGRDALEIATLKERLRAATVARSAARKALEQGSLNLIPDKVFDAIHEASSEPYPADHVMVGEPAVISAAKRIFEVFCGGPVDWSRHVLNDAEDNVFASADWAQAMRYAKAAIEAAPEIERLQAALGLYANPRNWRDTPPWDGDTLKKSAAEMFKAIDSEVYISSETCDLINRFERDFNAFFETSSPIIERCAQVAEAWKGHPADFHFAGKQIAKSIRALSAEVEG